MTAIFLHVRRSPVCSRMLNQEAHKSRVSRKYSGMIPPVTILQIFGSFHVGFVVLLCVFWWRMVASWRFRTDSKGILSFSSSSNDSFRRITEEVVGAKSEKEETQKKRACVFIHHIRLIKRRKRRKKRAQASFSWRMQRNNERVRLSPQFSTHTTNIVDHRQKNTRRAIPCTATYY